ncbi:hypothetical protein [Lentilactobacillus sp. Marseille-Q4993]|uniref:hypothetical protein n=1 Tax=Lentilactobacillus sp. Marseille-Q4993 TaxID=3039492 RepID=UPI0024BC7257|nr:hypothetical protein [Lentilactobacillus sp. Marseille-Q4993]
MEFMQSEQRMITEVKAGLLVNMQLVAVNFARSSNSSYWLIKVEDNGVIKWLTLRIASHKSWLENARAVEIVSDQSIIDSGEVKSELMKNWHRFASELTPVELAVLKLFMEMEQNGLVCLLELPADIDENHKAKPLNLMTDFMNSKLMIGSRNNVNKLRIEVDSSDFQSLVARLYGMNFLFSQFTVHRLMKLLPTNQWLEPVLSNYTDQNWWQALQERFGNRFIREIKSIIE